jgi:pimeloyl-ACP methyl ester carboxylesterase
MPFYEKGDVRIRYEEAGSGFPLLLTPGGGLNSRVSNWATAVFNAMEAFKDEFRCITMDQRNANGGESSGPIPVDDPWGAFADDQLGLMNHLGIREFFFMGYCIGGVVCSQAHGAGFRPRRGRCALPAGWAPLREPGRHVQFRPRCLGARATRASA